MPEIWGIQNTETGQWCSHYSINPNFCSWGGPETMQVFSSKQNAETAIDAWPGGSQNGKFIGQNPPPR